MTELNQLGILTFSQGPQIFKEVFGADLYDDALSQLQEGFYRYFPKPTFIEKLQLKWEYMLVGDKTIGFEMAPLGAHLLLGPAVPFLDERYQGAVLTLNILPRVALLDDVSIDDRFDRLLGEFPADPDKDVKELTRAVQSRAKAEGVSEHVTKAAICEWLLSRKFQRSALALLKVISRIGPEKLAEAEGLETTFMTCCTLKALGEHLDEAPIKKARQGNMIMQLDELIQVLASRVNSLPPHL